jgi:glycine/D-amino acid oxidase-like deaminating enzyme
MRLRTFEAYWLLKNGLLYTYPMLNKSISTDVIVVGAGITGALISHALMEEGYKTVLIDSKDIGQGSTSATTSMLQYEIDEPLHKLSEMIGESSAATCYQAGIDAIQTLEKLVKKHSFDCDFESKASLYIAHNLKAEKELKQEFELRKKYKLGVRWLTEKAILKDYGIQSKGGILSDTAASTDAYRLAHELIQYNHNKGMQVYDQTVVKKIDYQQKDITLTTEDHFRIKAKKIIFCTGYQTLEMFTEKIADVFYTWACVSEQAVKLKKKMFETLVWNTQEPYLYMRSTGDGRLLVGGEDSAYSGSLQQQKLKEKKSKKLVQKLEKLVPGIDFKEDFSWGGAFGSTKDGLPYIGEHPKYKNAIFVLSFGGNGITFSVQGMQIVKDLLKGKQNKLAQLYRFGR